MFKIYDTKLKLYTRPTYNSRARAQRAADRLDNEYGAYRYFVHEISLARAAERAA